MLRNQLRSLVIALVLVAQLPGAQALPSAAPASEPGTTAVRDDEAPVRTPVPAIAEAAPTVAERYAATDLDLDAAPGGLFVLGPDGAPVEGAKVACVIRKRQDYLDAMPRVLEVVETDASGLAVLESRSEATDVVAWSDELPPALLGGLISVRTRNAELLAEHRELAGEGALLVQLAESAYLSGRVLVDGAVPPAGFELTLKSAYMTRRWPAMPDDLERLLVDWDLPGRRFHATTDEAGRFRFVGFPWAHYQLDGRPARQHAMHLSWRDRELFRVGPADRQRELADFGRLRVSGSQDDLLLELGRGGWLTGQVVSPLGEPVRGKLRFRLPDSKDWPDELELDDDGRFQRRVPLPFPTFDTLFDLDLWSGEGRMRPDEPVGPTQAFHVEPPSAAKLARVRPAGGQPDADPTWDLGRLVFGFEDCRQLVVLDAAGAPLVGAAARLVTLSELAGASDLFGESAGETAGKTAGTLPGTTDARGRLLVRLPDEGFALEVRHPEHESALVEDFDSADGRLVVRLSQSAELALVVQLPGGVLAHRVLVQLEAEAPARRLYPEDRTSYRSEARGSLFGAQTARLVDAGSPAAWSHTVRLGPPDRLAHEREAFQTGATVRLELPGMLPGVPFHVRVLEPTGLVFIERALPGFRPGEHRELALELPAPTATLRGRVVDAAGLPAVSADVHFGALVPTFVATTDDEGRFVVAGSYASRGKLLVEQAGTWTAEGLFSSSSGRTPNARLFEDDFHFDPTGAETLIQLPTNGRLVVDLVEANGQRSSSPWKLHLFDESGHLYLGGTSVFPLQGDAGARALSRVPGVPLWLEVSCEGATVRQRVEPSEAKVQVRVPTFGSIQTLRPDDHEDTGDPVDGFLLTPKDGGTSFWRRNTTWVSPGKLEHILPGRYSMQPCSWPDYGANRLPVGDPIEVSVRAGEAIDVVVP